MKTIETLYALADTSYFKIEKWSSSKELPLSYGSLPDDNSDYLMDTKINKDVLKLDTIKLHTDVLEYETISNDERELISNFLIPYRISMIKYRFNRKFYLSPEFGYASFIDPKLKAGDADEYVAPSLRWIAMNPEYLVKFYPDFFFMAFPDVVYWTLEPGMLKVNELLSSYKRSLVFMNDLLSDEMIKALIDLYIETTRQKLECSMVD